MKGPAVWPQCQCQAAGHLALAGARELGNYPTLSQCWVIIVSVQLHPSPAQPHHSHIILNQSNKSQTCGEQLRGETAATAVPRQISSYTSFCWNKTAMETLLLGINLILETCVVCMSHYWLSIEYCYEFKAAYILDEAMWYVDVVFWRVVRVASIVIRDMPGLLSPPRPQLRTRPHLMVN